MHSLRRQIGQRLVVGLPGQEVPDDLKRLIQERYVANIILFSHNVRDKEQLFALCGELQRLVRESTGAPAFITIDQEGGVVSRLPKEAANAPSAMCVGATGDPENAYRVGKITGQELSALGVNFDLAPVMDVNSNPHNPAIGARSYGDTPQRVAAFGAEMIRGLKAGGVLTAAKHFPGHGDTAVDSHLGLPLVDKTLDELEACELIPFRAAIAAGVDAVMTTHILFPQLEPERIPATMSRNILTGLLRERLHFQGLILSDCMMMQAIERFYGTVNGILAAANAGVDMLFTSHSVEYAREASLVLEKAVEAGTISRESMAASARRVLDAKAGLRPAREGLETVGCPAHRAVMRRVMEQGLTLARGALLPLGPKPLFVGCPPYRLTDASSDDGVSFPSVMTKLLGGEGIVTSLDPTPAEIAAYARQAAGHSCVVAGTYNGHLKPGQLELVRALAKGDAPVICVALRNPYDLLDLPKSVACVAAYAYDALSMEAVAGLLRGELTPGGALPLTKIIGG